MVPVSLSRVPIKVILPAPLLNVESVAKTTLSLKRMLPVVEIRPEESEVLILPCIRVVPPAFVIKVPSSVFVPIAALLPILSPMVVVPVELRVSVLRAPGKLSVVPVRVIFPDPELKVILPLKTLYRN